MTYQIYIVGDLEIFLGEAKTAEAWESFGAACELGLAARIYGTENGVRKLLAQGC